MNLMARRRALTGKTQKKPVLPSDYQAVEWVGATSSGPYIITSTTLTNGPLKVHAKVQCTSYGPYGADIMGVRRGNNAGQQAVMIKAVGTPAFTIQGGNGGSPIYVTQSSCGLSAGVHDVYEIVVDLDRGNTDSGVMTVSLKAGNEHGSATRTGGAGNNSQKPFSLFGSVSTSTRPCGKVFFARVWNEGNLVIDAVPCYRKSDNVIGMYDFVTESFYTNAGSGALVKGLDI